jgi:hypothetical protein
LHPSIEVKRGSEQGQKMRDGAARKPFLTLYQRESFRSNLAEIQFNSLDGGLNTRTQEKKKLNG